MLRKLINELPTTTIHLGEDKDGGVVNELPPVILPISDHDIILGANKHGTFATWNSLNPESPASLFAPAGISGLVRINREDEKKDHIEQISKMIIALFKNDVDAIALQEVPAMREHHYTDFIAELKKLAAEEKIELHFNAFETSYALTKKPLKKGVEQGYHGFATALLFKTGKFSLEKTTSLPDGRGSIYSLTSAKSKEEFNLINLHGDYGQADNLVTQISKYYSIPNTIIVGDTNVALSKKSAVDQFATMEGVVVEPTVGRSKSEDSRTLDCFVTTIPTSYVYKTDSHNYAKNVESRKTYDFFAAASCAAPEITDTAAAVQKI